MSEREREKERERERVIYYNTELAHRGLSAVDVICRHIQIPIIKTEMVRRSLSAVACICRAARMLRRRLLGAKFKHWHQGMRISATHALEVQPSFPPPFIYIYIYIFASEIGPCHFAKAFWEQNAIRDGLLANTCESVRMCVPHLKPFS